MRRYTARPYGQSISGLRVVSGIFAILVLGMLYQRLKDPALWNGFVSDQRPVAKMVPKVAPSDGSENEKLVPHPDDRDENEVAAVQQLFEFVTDRSPLKSREMDAYWRLMDWSRAQPFAELEQRAKDDIPFTQFWEQPERYRGKAIRLRLHVRRVIEYDAPENPAGITKVCEAWGWTDESRSFPYVVVFPEPPQGMPIGTDVRSEIVFAGYFLKMMTYTAFDHARATPLLVGRVRLASPSTLPVRNASDSSVIVCVGTAVVVSVALMIWVGKGGRQTKSRARLPDQLSELMPVAFDDSEPTK